MSSRKDRFILILVGTIGAVLAAALLGSLVAFIWWAFLDTRPIHLEVLPLTEVEEPARSYAVEVNDCVFHQTRIEHLGNVDCKMKYEYTRRNTERVREVVIRCRFRYEDKTYSTDFVLLDFGKILTLPSYGTYTQNVRGASIGLQPQPVTVGTEIFCSRNNA